MTLPNFLVVGAGRSGTTSLHRYLDQHPDIFVPSVKAPSYFYAVGATTPTTRERQLIERDHFVHDDEAYEALFASWSGEAAVGEVSPAYLCAPRVPPLIAERLPEVRIVAVIRNPVDRLYARYVARRRDGLEREADLASIVRRECARPFLLEDTAGTYVAAGFLSHVLRAYLERFATDQIRLFLYDDLQREPDRLLRDLFSFLGVDPDTEVDLTTVHNRSGGMIANPLLRSVWTRSAPVRLRMRRHVPARVRDRAFALFTRRLVAEPMGAELRRQLVELYRSEVGELADLLDRDLTHWLLADGLDTPISEDPR